MEYASLRSTAMEVLQQLTGYHWTDHNVHDPGITILEQFCYALTDLSYRTDFPVADLLAEGGRSAWRDTFSPRRMLHTGPLTLKDWRRILLDIPGVANVRITPVDTTTDAYRPPVYYDRALGAIRLEAPAAYHQIEPLGLRGLYCIDYVLEEPADPSTEDAQEKEVTAAIRARFHAHRNLCEDLYAVRRLAEQPIAVEARIEIGAVTHPENLLAAVYDRIRLYLSPSIRFYTLQEQLAKGYSLSEIMDGPALAHGYLDETELEDFHPRHSLRISDLIHLIMELEGVNAVRSLKLKDEAGNILAATQPGQPWEWSLEADRVGSLAILHDLENELTPGVRLQREGKTVAVDWAETRQLISEHIEAEDPHGQDKSPAELDQLLPLGRNRKVGSYQSILHQFPSIYGVGQDGLPPNSSPRRRGQVLQLKAYLGFFDQLLANEFSQLAGFRSFFDLDKLTATTTYFSQSLSGVAPGIEAVLPAAAEPMDLEETSREKRISRQRRKRLIHHLLARFGVAFTCFSESAGKTSLKREKEFLRHYARASYRRFQAFDYTIPSWGTDNVSGLQARLYRLLDLGEIRFTALAELTKEAQGGFHLLEHILLRPTPGDEYQQSPILLLPFNGDDNNPPREDPYSLQISFVLPAWIDRFKAEHPFRTFLVRTLREQSPAHLRIYLHWLDQPDMANFEVAYRAWLEQLRL